VRKEEDEDGKTSLAAIVIMVCANFYPTRRHEERLLVVIQSLLGIFPWRSLRLFPSPFWCFVRFGVCSAMGLYIHCFYKEKRGEGKGGVCVDGIYCGLWHRFD